MKNYLCIDFGGTKTLVSIIAESGEVQTEVRIETPDHYPEFLDLLCNEINQLPEKFTTGVMAIPGLIDQENGTVIALGNRPWEHFAIQKDVLERTGIDLNLLNDARLAGLAEAVYLSGQYRRVLYITVSTGIGGALAVDGTLVRELDDMEFGHMPLYIDGAYVDWEEIASGKSIFEKYDRKATDIHEPEIWKDIAHNLTLGLGPVCAAYQPDAIVFGGGVGKQSDKFAHFVQAELAHILHPVVRQPQALLPCHYEDESVIYGCFELGKQYAASN